MKKRDVNLYLTTISLIIGFGYVLFYMLSGRNQNPLTYRYQKVLNDKLLLKKHILFASILSLIGLFRFNSLTLETYLFSPFIFILLLLLSNTIIHKIYNRNILIEIGSRYSYSPRVNKKATFLDIFFGLLIVLISLVGPIAMKYDKFDKMNEERKKFNSEKHTTLKAATLESANLTHGLQEKHFY